MMFARPSHRALAVIGALFALGIVASAGIDMLGADTALLEGLYSHGGANHGWKFGREIPWGPLYDYGEIPVLVMLACAVGLGIAAYLKVAPRHYLKPCLVVILTTALGPGLLVNGILKPGWGRPRPAEIVQFGGTEQYAPPWKPQGPGRGKSFTCGHCAMAFAVSSGIAFYPVHPAGALTALAGGVLYGAVMGVARMAQGGHFPTDVLWSAVLVYAVIVGLYYGLGVRRTSFRRETSDPRVSRNVEKSADRL